MKLKLTQHFQDMMQLRGINLDHVKSAMKLADSTKHTFGGRIVARKTVDGKTIEVIYSKESFKDKSNEYLVITAYYI